MKKLAFPRGPNNGPFYQNFFAFFCFLLCAPHCIAGFAETLCHGVAQCRIKKSGFMRVCGLILYCLSRSETAQNVGIAWFSECATKWHTAQKIFLPIWSKCLSLICSENPKCTPFSGKLDFSFRSALAFSASCWPLTCSCE